MDKITYYVDPIDGNDLNDGLSASTPMRRLSRFFTQPLDFGEVHPDKSPIPYILVQPVDILLKRGTITDQIVSINRTGTASAKLKISSYGDGPLPQIYGIIGQAGTGISYTEITRLKFATPIKYQNIGLDWKAVGQNVHVHHCTFTGLMSAWAFRPPDASAGGHLRDFIIEDNKISDMKSTQSHSGGGYQQGFANLIIRRNAMKNVGNVNDQFDQGLYLHGDSISATIEENIIQCDGNVGIQCRGGRFNVINNLVTKCAFGITMGSGTDKKECGGKIVNNVVLYGRDLGVNPISCGIAIAMTEDGTEVGNNIISHKDGTSASSSFGALCYGNKEAFEYTSLINANVRRRKSGNPIVHDNVICDWSPALVLSERSEGGFTGNYYLVRENETILKIVNSSQWSVTALNRQFVLPEQVAEMCMINTWWAPNARWQIRMEGWDHSPMIIGNEKAPILDPGSTQTATAYTNLFDVRIETYLRESVGLPNNECTYDRFMDEALKDDGAAWATAAAFNDWARSRVGLA